MASIAESAKFNDKVLEAGCIALTDFAGSKLYFFPRGRLPRNLVADLNADGGRLSIQLRNFLINLGKG
jgi:hypothetical protein